MLDQSKIYTIGIDARMYGPEQTGIGNYIRHLIVNLAEIDKRNNYIIFLLDKEYGAFKLPAENFRKARVFSHWYSWREQILLPWEFSKECLDLMHFPHFNTPVLYSGKSVVTIHDITPFFFPGHKMNSWLRRNAFKFVFNSSIKKASGVIAVSSSTKNDIVKYFGLKSGKIDVVYEGVDENFKILPNRGKIREELSANYNVKKPFIFYAGVWRNHKNIVGLLKAFSIIKKRLGGKYQLVLGGKEDPYYPEIKETICELNLEKDIITPGFIPDSEMALFYNSCAIFVIPSFYEGFGLVGLEAFACGTPVVSSNTTSLPEVLGSSALYFDPRDEEQMAAIMIEALENEKTREQMIQNGLKQVQKYSWRRMAEETHDIYNKILEKKYQNKNYNSYTDYHK